MNTDVTIVYQLQQAIENTESIISTLLEVSKLDTGAIQPKLTCFSLHTMLEGLVNEARVQLPEGLQIRYCKTSVTVNSDKHYLRRILQNFISNAIKYTRRGKVLVGCRRIHNEQQQACVEICVYDNGAGISARERTLIFDDFYRIHHPAHSSSEQQKIPGVGLGLSVVARFGELLNHPVNCRSELHRGSCFSVIVPLAEKTEVPPSLIPLVIILTISRGCRWFMLMMNRIICWQPHRY